MSYARFGWDDSDVYVFLSVGGWIECCSCHLRGDHTSEQLHSADEMIAHLKEHEKAGDTVPPETYDEIREDEKFIAEYVAEQQAVASSQEDER